MTKTNDSLLEFIPENRRTPQQKTFRRWRYGEDVPLYRLKREPHSLEDIDGPGEYAIWRDNGTVICVCKHAFDSYCYRGVCFWMTRAVQPDWVGVIFGLADDEDCADFSQQEMNAMVDANIAETATFLWSLKDSSHYLQIDRNDEMSAFSFSAIHPDDLATILDAHPTRLIELQNGTWSAEQAVVLATRSFPLKLKLSDSPISLMDSRFRFRDRGTAFVKALEERTSPFGSLAFSFLNTDDMPFSRDNLERLLKCEFDKLEIGVLHKELALLPFSMKTAALDYKINADCFMPRDFQSLAIVTKDLHLKVLVDDGGDGWYWDKLLIAFFKRVAALGHFEKLGLSVRYWDEDGGGWGATYKPKRIAVVADALVGAIRANPKLSCLDLSDPDSIVEWGPHLTKIRQAVEDHGGLHSFLVKKASKGNGYSDYTWDEDEDDDSEDDYFGEDDDDDDDDDDSNDDNMDG